ncbi:Protein of unknown function DUF1644 [Macleaya cordata]|uniref:Zinc finger protein n=1 Tax=Macleaya cordata TaxID=56857 RepID=A0A200PQJ2_MACCD|nr:Protein of unknown function DUF1644 [Macleaya cordata]
MPKDRKDRSLSSRTSPYPCSSRRTLRSSSKNPLEPVEDVKEWEEARCPVCMEHPHNAVLLLCSSHEKGCRPYMCDTSYRHSNCLDQFRKASGETPTTSPEEDPHASTGPHVMVTSDERIADPQEERSNEVTPPAPTLPCESQLPQKLSCPLCRGQVNGWIVVEPARQFMNAKARSCACETCDFNGNYADLRKHARIKHPLVRPSEADPQRQHDWRMLERERDLGDVLSTIQSAFGEERADDSVLIPTNGGLLSVLIFFRVSRTPLTESGGSSSNSSSSVWSSPSRSRGQTRSRRRTSMAALWGENYEAETGSSTRDGENGSSEGVPPPGSWRLLERNRRWTASDEES